ncbi:hypothetical protein WA026_017241 [Henosepilachna vigintioctopunctata]|uniref:Uncharacterized protein n=1 Tax=Henosepilachna vigintioctopunctata TaxID=420089 RepID=A0AAW1UMJ9_9CUCU
MNSNESPDRRRDISSSIEQNEQFQIRTAEKADFVIENHQIDIEYQLESNIHTRYPEYNSSDLKWLRSTNTSSVIKLRKSGSSVGRRKDEIHDLQMSGKWHLEKNARIILLNEEIFWRCRQSRIKGNSSLSFWTLQECIRDFSNIQEIHQHQIQDRTVQKISDSSKCSRFTLTKTAIGMMNH